MIHVWARLLDPPTNTLIESRDSWNYSTLRTLPDAELEVANTLQRLVETVEQRFQTLLDET